MSTKQGEEWGPLRVTAEMVQESVGKFGADLPWCRTVANRLNGILVPLLVRKVEEEKRQIECDAILALMGKEPYLAKGHIDNGEYKWTVVADKVSVTELRGGSHE